MSKDANKSHLTRQLQKHPQHQEDPIDEATNTKKFSTTRPTSASINLFPSSKKSTSSSGSFRSSSSSSSSSSRSSKVTRSSSNFRPSSSSSSSYRQCPFLDKWLSTTKQPLSSSSKLRSSPITVQRLPFTEQQPPQQSKPNDTKVRDRIGSSTTTTKTTTGRFIDDSKVAELRSFVVGTRKTQQHIRNNRRRRRRPLQQQQQQQKFTNKSSVLTMGNRFSNMFSTDTSSSSQCMLSNSRCHPTTQDSSINNNTTTTITSSLVDTTDNLSSIESRTNNNNNGNNRNRSINNNNNNNNLKYTLFSGVRNDILQQLSSKQTGLGSTTSTRCSDVLRSSDSNKNKVKATPTTTTTTTTIKKTTTIIKTTTATKNSSNVVTTATASAAAIDQDNDDDYNDDTDTDNDSVMKVNVIDIATTFSDDDDSTDIFLDEAIITQQHATCCRCSLCLLRDIKCTSAKQKTNINNNNNMNNDNRLFDLYLSTNSNNTTTNNTSNHNSSEVATATTLSSTLQQQHPKILRKRSYNQSILNDNTYYQPWKKRSSENNDYTEYDNSADNTRSDDRNNNFNMDNSNIDSKPYCSSSTSSSSNISSNSSLLEDDNSPKIDEIIDCDISLVDGQQQQQQQQVDGNDDINHHQYCTLIRNDPYHDVQNDSAVPGLVERVVVVKPISDEDNSFGNTTNGISSLTTRSTDCSTISQKIDDSSTNSILPPGRQSTPTSSDASDNYGEMDLLPNNNNDDDNDNLPDQVVNKSLDGTIDVTNVHNSSTETIQRQPITEVQIQQDVVVSTTKKTKKKKSKKSKNKKNSMATRTTMTTAAATATATTAGTYFTIEEFETMWNIIEQKWGCTLETIEDSSFFREGNGKLSVEESRTQLKAQYGRIKCRTLKRLFDEVYNIQPHDIFVDIGHGVGIANLQAAYTIGCESRGIELVFNRHHASLFFQKNLDAVRETFHESGRAYLPVGRIELRQGKLEDPKHRDFLVGVPASSSNNNNNNDKNNNDNSSTSSRRGVTKAFVNNFGNVYGERSAKNRSTVYLDNYVAGLFALMVPGSIMVTMHPLSLPPPRREVNENRRRHDMTTGESNASFYDFEKISLGEARGQVSWAGGSCTNELFVWKYTRLQQDSSDPVFLCSNPNCEHATKNIPNSAIRTLDNGDGIVVDASCEHEGCRKIQRNLRRRFVYYGAH